MRVFRFPALEQAPASKAIAVTELTLASLLWGLGYVASKWALTSIDASWLAFIRFFVAALVGYWILGKPLSRHSFSSLWDSLGPAKGAGLSLGVTLLLQTLSLRYTSVTRCGFLTGLYVVFVPILELWILGRTNRGLLWLWVGLALTGTCLLCHMQTADWNVGDALAVGCAITAALQVVLVDRISRDIGKPFLFNTAQSLWACLPLIATSAIFESPPYLPWTAQAWVGMWILAIGCTLIGFWLQIRSQKVLKATVVSMIFLLEAPFAAFFGFVFFGETLAWPQALGAALIFLACWGVVRDTSHTAQSA